jgi:uncharacterized protein YjiS (DUF1127 family)
MAHIEAHAKIRASKHQPLGSSSKVAIIFAAFTAWRRTIAGRKAIRELTTEQLKDIGYPEPPAPTFVVRAGLMSDLMSMR